MTDSHEMIRWLMQTVHRAYHADHDGLMETCPKDLCASTRQFFAELHEKDVARAEALPTRHWCCPLCDLPFEPTNFDPWTRTLFCPTCKLTTLTLPPSEAPPVPDPSGSAPPPEGQYVELMPHCSGCNRRYRNDSFNAATGRYCCPKCIEALKDQPVAAVGRAVRSASSAVVAPTPPEEPVKGVNEPLQSPPEARPEANTVAELLGGVLSTGFALRRLQKLALKTGLTLSQLTLLMEAERNVAEFAARFTPSAHEATPDGPPEVRERLQNELNRLFERNHVENPLAGSPFAIPWAGRAPSEAELREAMKAGHIWAPFVPLQITNAFPGFVEKAAEVEKNSKPTRPENFNHDDKSLCPRCNLYNLKDPHKPWCERI